MHTCCYSNAIEQTICSVCIESIGGKVGLLFCSLTVALIFWWVEFLPKLSGLALALISQIYHDLVTCADSCSVYSRSESVSNLYKSAYYVYVLQIALEAVRVEKKSLLVKEKRGTEERDGEGERGENQKSVSLWSSHPHSIYMGRKKLLLLWIEIAVCANVCEIISFTILVVSMFLCDCVSFFPLQSGVLSIRGTPTHLIIISWTDGIYKTTVGDPDDKKEVKTHKANNLS